MFSFQGPGHNLQFTIYNSLRLRLSLSRSKLRRRWFHRILVSLIKEQANRFWAACTSVVYVIIFHLYTRQLRQSNPSPTDLILMIHRSKKTILIIWISCVGRERYCTQAFEVANLGIRCHDPVWVGVSSRAAPNTNLASLPAAFKKWCHADYYCQKIRLAHDSVSQALKFSRRFMLMPRSFLPRIFFVPSSFWVENYSLGLYHGRFGFSCPFIFVLAFCKCFLFISWLIVTSVFDDLAAFLY